MVEEQGVIVRIEEDALWVETLQTSTCEACSAQKGCGQRVLGRMFQQATAIRILLKKQKSDDFVVNQTVTIGIPENVIVLGSIGIYLIPLIVMLVGASLVSMAGLSEGRIITGAVFGLLAGGGLVRWFSSKNTNNPDLQPVLIDY